MKCKSCSEEISQKFAHSISINVCPYCGSDIMDEALQIVLSELMEVMKATEQYKEEMFEWLNINYNLIDGNSEEYKALTEKKIQPKQQIKIRKDPSEVQLDEKGNQLTGESIQDPETTNVFMNRAGIKQNQDHYKEIVSRIKKASGNNGPAESLSIADVAQASAEDIEAMENMIMQEQGPVVHSAISNYVDDGDEGLDPIAETLARMGSSNKAPVNPNDLKTLQRMQQGRSASRELGSGGSVGMIRRS